MTRNRPVDPDGLLEYSVVFTDWSLNHMSRRFQQVMRDISTNLKAVYQGETAIVVPGGGSYGMESVARQFANDKKCLVIRNGWFSYRWSQIFEMGKIPSAEIVLKAQQTNNHSQSPFAPTPINQVIDTIRKEKPDLIFAPHVETASGILLPDDYLKAMAEAVHASGGLFVLDCVASGALWVDMKKIGVDVLISAPQKGWSASPCAALIVLSEAATARLNATNSSSFAADLKKWRQIMASYENGAFGYHATMPTDSLLVLRDAMNETISHGLDNARQQQQSLGTQVRQLMTQKGYPSVAAPGFEAPGVVVSYTNNPALQSGKAFAELGLQTAAGVPLQCDEGEDFKTFRVGLFGLEKLRNVERTVNTLKDALDKIG